MNCRVFLQVREIIKKQRSFTPSNFLKFLFLRREQSFMILFISYHSHIEILKTKIEKTIFHILSVGCCTANSKAPIRHMLKWKKEYLRED